MHVDYDTFARLSPLRKNDVLHKLSPENRAELVVTQWQRFLDANRSRLNSEQVAFLEEIIAYIRPELYDERRVRTEEEFNRDRDKETTMFRLFSREDVLKLHAGAMKNSGEIRNALARALIRVPRNAEDLEPALLDLARLPLDELRQKRPDLPEVLARHIEGVPDNFWSHVDDEDVRLAARRARGMVHKMRNPLALVISRTEPRGGEDFAPALRDLRDLSLESLRRTRADLPDLLARHFDNVPSGEEFWQLASDEEVRVAASRAYVFVTQPWLRSVAPPHPPESY